MIRKWVFPMVCLTHRLFVFYMIKSVFFFGTNNKYKKKNYDYKVYLKKVDFFPKNFLQLNLK